MKKLLFLILMTLLILTSCEYDGEPLDLITDYQITVNPRDDGTLDMRYHIEWKVLDSIREGPLSWVKIGIPNKYVDEIKSHSYNIDQISYSADGGAYIRIVLERKYYAGETVTLDFSFHQSRIFTSDSEYVYYNFKPGWFDEIRVENLTVLWTKDNVIGNNSLTSTDNYYCWNTSLDFGETIEVKLQYDKNAFPNIDLTQNYSFEDGDISKYIILAIIILVIVSLIVVFIIGNIASDGYYSYRGFYVRGHHYHFWHRHGVNKHGKRIQSPKVVSTGGGRWSGGSGCACACACACAGGGRAGCSRKDFYQTSANIDLILEKLKKE